MPELIDSHCHLEKFARAGELDAVLGRATDTGVGRLITVGTSVKDWSFYAEMAAAHRGRIFHTVGLHPCDVEDDWEDQVSAIASFFAGSGQLPVALGETGLDHFHLPKEEAAAQALKARQEGAFRAQLDIARQLDCPVIVHSRNCFHECVRVIDHSGMDWERVVFHCFADGPEEIQQLRARGGRASFTGIVTFKSAENVQAAAVEQGLDVLMIETDSPYLAPVPYRGKRNEPAYVAHTATRMAELLGVSEVELAARTTANAEAFFGLKNHSG